jgi:hypothetical protein
MTEDVNIMISSVLVTSFKILIWWINAGSRKGRKVKSAKGAKVEHNLAFFA